MPSTKPRICIYLSEDMYARISGYSEKLGWTASKIVETALQSWFSHEAGDKRDAALVKRLDKLSRQMDVSECNQIVTSEALALLVRYFLTLMPPVPDTDREAVKATGAHRYESYMQALKTILGDGERILFTALDEVRVERQSFFTKDDILHLDESNP